MGMMEKLRERAKAELKKEIIQEMHHEGVNEEESVHDGSVNLDAHRELEGLVKSRLGARHVVMCAEMLDGTVLTYIPEEIGDKDLVYLIQTLEDLRAMRLNE